MRLPPGASRQRFSQALREFESAVGKDWVFTRDEDVALYNDAYSPFAAEPAAQLVASAAVAPVSVEQVQQIVRTANKYKIPLFATSTGRNLGYGGSAPIYAGSVVVDLKRMNRVLEVSNQDAYAIVEPGVNFIELYRYFEEHHHPFMVSAPEPGWGGPVGNALDHGVSFVAGDNFAMAKGLEVVLPNGELLRTGMGALPNGRLWQNYPYGFGPYVDGLFSQSNFGIVTKMGLWLVPKPEMQTSFTVSSFKSDDLHPLIETVQSMRMQGLLYLSSGTSPIRSGQNSAAQGPLAQHIPEVMALLSRRDGGSPTEWEALGRAKNIPVSLVGGSIRGPAKIVAATLEYARELFGKIPGVRFQQDSSHRFPLDPEQVLPPERPHLGIPNLWIFTPVAMETSRGLYFFSPICRASAEDLFGINQTIREVLLEHADDYLKERLIGWKMAATVFPKSYVFTYDFPVFDDADRNRRYREVFQRLVEACSAQGWSEYRTHGAFQSQVMSQYSFNNHALLRFHEQMKDALDPNGILAPGKSGIWPRHLRKPRS